MGCLLSVDWDYFVYCKDTKLNSFLENKKNVIDLWYKKYFYFQEKGININKYYDLSLEIKTFWQKIKSKFNISNDAKVFVSDSHKLSYNIAKTFKCDIVYLFDSHSDLGYGGIDSLDFEVNCANWLGKLFKDKYIKKAYIVYSKHTLEKPIFFESINKIYNIKYLSFENINTNIPITAIHVCRSGAWTPPWYDNKFFEFVNQLKIPFKVIDCPKRKWNPQNISLSDKIFLMIS